MSHSSCGLLVVPPVEDAAARSTSPRTETAFPITPHSPHQNHTMPTFVPGAILTRASISITADNLPPFQDPAAATHLTHWWPLPYAGGPNMQWGNHSAGWAITRASVGTEIQNSTLLDATLEINGRVGGKCGKNGSNTGGSGRLNPEYRGLLGLNAADPSWVITLDARFFGSAPTDPPGASMPDAQVQFLDPSNAVVHASAVPYNAPASVNTTFSRPPDVLTVVVAIPPFLRGCLGSPENTASESEATFRMRITVVP